MNQKTGIVTLSEVREKMKSKDLELAFNYNVAMIQRDRAPRSSLNPIFRLILRPFGQR